MTSRIALGHQLDQTYQQVATNLSSNPLARVEKVDGKDELVLTSPDKLEEPVATLAVIMGNPDFRP